MNMSDHVTPPCGVLSLCLTRREVETHDEGKIAWGPHEKFLPS